MGKLFGTDGVRGVANLELTPMLAFELGRAGATVLAAENKHKPKILVGMDTRISCDMLESALVAGICSVGAEVITLGVIPTPAVAALVLKYKADAGVVISASHNSYEFNGIKFFGGNGYKLPDDVENKIEDIILNKKELETPIKDKLGYRRKLDTCTAEYAEFAKNAIEGDLSGLRIAIDCANGAAFQVAPTALKELGADVTVMNAEPNGININHDCGSTHMQSLSNLLKNGDYDMGLAFDGDADRVLAMDENGEIIDGDKILAIIAKDLKAKNALADNTIVVTVMSNLGLDIFAKKEGIHLVKTGVGDRYVLEEMVKKGYSIGGEQSGHVILLNHNTTGDGLLVGIKLLSIYKKLGQKASDLAKIMDVLPQVLVNAKVNNKNKYKYMEDDVIKGMCEKLEHEFNGEGRVLIRPSGTEPLVRVMIEGKDQGYISAKASDLAKMIENRLG